MNIDPNHIPSRRELRVQEEAEKARAEAQATTENQVEESPAEATQEAPVAEATETETAPLAEKEAEAASAEESAPEAAEKDSEDSSEKGEIIVEMKGIYKDFTQGDETIHALKPTDFTARKGEFIALIGPSGSGKSTMLTIIGGLQTPTGGTIKVGGRDLSELSDKQRAKARLDEIGFILQSANLVPFLTVNEQLDLYDRVAKTKNQPGHTQKDRDELFESLGILKLKNKYKSDLSGGEKQRAAIARALYATPSVILADEPTAALDSKKAFAVAELLREQAKVHDTCIIMVTHDERLIDHVDAVYRMEDGELTKAK
ncbi:ABC transporter ATP-binding protein [Boudabousia liubingyangii]